jgi:ribosomal protein L37AE/L43A
MTVCSECGDNLPEKRAAMGIKICLECQGELERTGQFQKHKMEIYQDISGWQCEGVKTKLIPGGVKK